MGRVLAVDPGSRRVGLAISDEDGVIAQPLPSMAAAPAATLPERIAAFARTQGADRLVVGLPRRLDGSRGPEVAGAESLARALRTASGLPVQMVDERLTTAEAERSLLSQGHRRERRRELVDGVAAALILRSFLEQASRGR